MSQSLSNVILHVIFSTKDRIPYIQPNLELELHAYIVKLCNLKGCFVHVIGGVEDHLHLLITLPRTLTISALLEDIKKISSKWVKENVKGLKDFAWQNGYGVFSVSESVKDNVINYIKNQKEHHKKISFKDEFLKFLKVNNVPYNENYLWT